MNKTVVVDASVAVKWILREPDSAIAKALLAEWIQAGTVILAPDLLIYEFTNILHKNVRGGNLIIDEAMKGLEYISSVGVEFEFLRNVQLSKRALELAYQFNLPATYDPHYLALAEREECEFWTTDSRLWNTVKEKLSWVHLFTEHQLT